MKYLRAMLLFFLITAVLNGETAPEPVKIGILAKRGVQKCYEQWNPTAVFLTERIEGIHFIIVPLDFLELETAVNNHDIDFVLTNSSYYVYLVRNYNLSRIATLKNSWGSDFYTEFGGVIFTSRDNEGISSIRDLKNKTFAAVDRRSLGGWIAARKEFYDLGINPEKYFSSVEFAGTHDLVISMVLSGEASAGTVRTDTIERMAAEGKLDPGKLKILEDKSGRYKDFPFAVSTELYPEWPFSKLADTDNELAEKVSSSLITMSPDSSAARAAVCSGWTIPSTYSKVDRTLEILHLPPYEDYGRITFSAVFRQYKGWIAAICAALILAAAGVAAVTRLNRSLKEAVDRGNSELRKREQAEKRLLEIQVNQEQIIASRTSELQDKNRILQDTLQTNRDLVREVHHRVKNNLQIIISLMNIQKNQQKQTSSDMFCVSTQRRIASMSIVHELLFSSEYLDSLSAEKLLDMIGRRSGEIGEADQINTVMLPSLRDHQIKLDIAIPLGLILSELLTNAYKHSSAEGADGKITMEIQDYEEGIIIKVSDNGKGFPEGFTPDKSPGLGMQLVSILAEQVHGEISFFNEHGAVAQIKIPNT